MEEKKFDMNSLVGFLLIGGILLWMLYNNQPTPEEIEAEKTKTEQVTDAEEAFTPTTISEEENATTQDSAAVARAQSLLGAFGYSASLPSAKAETTTISNEVLELKVNNKGGYIEEARIKGYKTYDSIPVYLIKDGNASFNLNFSTTDGRTLDSQNLFFEPTVTQSGDNTVLSMKLKVS